MLDLDSSLSLEDEYYQAGYKDGAEVGTRQGLIEGRIYGSEKSYERFHAAGLCYGKLSIWRLQRNDRIAKHLDRVEELLNRLPLDNAEREDGDDYDAIMAQIVAKFKVIASICGENLAKAGILSESSTLGDVEDGVRKVQGRVKLCG